MLFIIEAVQSNNASSDFELLDCTTLLRFSFHELLYEIFLMKITYKLRFIDIIVIDSLRDGARY